MQFLKTLFWVVIAGLLTILGSRNWHDVTLNLWGDIQADVKVPVLLAFMVFVGWLPTYLIYRTRLWRMRQRLASFERQQATAVRPAPQVAEEAPTA